MDELSIVKKILQRSAISLPTKYTDLGISKDELYRYYDSLKEKGYIDFYIAHDGTMFGEDPTKFSITKLGEEYLRTLQRK